MSKKHRPQCSSCLTESRASFGSIAAAKMAGWQRTKDKTWRCATCKPTRKRGMSADKAHVFGTYWRMLRPTAVQPVSEYPVTAVIGRKHRADWAFVEQRVLVEVDGGSYAFRGGRHATDEDRVKLNLCAALGWRTIRFSPQMLERDPVTCCQVVAWALGIEEMPMKKAA